MKMKTNREKKSKSTSVSDEAFAELEQSLKEALAYEKGEIESLRVTKRAIPPYQNKGQKLR